MRRRDKGVARAVIRAVIRAVMRAVMRAVIRGVRSARRVSKVGRRPTYFCIFMSAIFFLLITFQGRWLVGE